MSYLTIFQHDFIKDIGKYPISVDVLEDIPEIGAAFLMNTDQERLWEITSCEVYKPFQLKTFLFEGIIVLGIASLADLPKGFNRLDYVSIEIPEEIPHLGFLGEGGLNEGVDFFKNGVIRADEGFFNLSF